MTTDSSTIQEAPVPFKEQFKDLLLPGLAGDYSYIAINKSLGDDVHAAVKPWIFRYNDVLVAFGVKLRLGYTGNYVSGNTSPSYTHDGYFSSAAGKTRADVLRGKVSSPQPFTWTAVSDVRVSTVLVTLITAGRNDLAAFRAVSDLYAIANKVLDAITERTGITIEERRTVIKALVNRYEKELPRQFETPPTYPAPGLVGTQSTVVNFGDEETDKPGLEAWVKTVAPDSYIEGADADEGDTVEDTDDDEDNF